MSINFTQPTFAENIVAGVQAYLEKIVIDGDLIIVRPNYNEPIGGNNLFRTSMYLGTMGVAPEHRIVHLSNLLYDGDTMVVSFETEPGMVTAKVATRSYQSPTKIATKEHLVSNLNCRLDHVIHQDIAEFLLSGKIPNGNEVS